MADFVLCALANLFRMYLIRRFITIFLGEAPANNKKEKIFFFCFYIVNTALFWKYHTAWVNALTNLAGISLIVMLYTNSVKTNIFVTLTIYLLNCACDVPATLLFVDYQEGKSHSQICFIVMVFFFFISEILTEKIVSNKKSAETVQNFSLLSVPLCSIAVICILIYSNACNNFGMIIVSTGFLITNFLMLYLYDLLLSSALKIYETEALRKQVQIYASQLDVIVQSEEKIKIMRHDMKHHINELKLLANKYRAEEMQKYIDHMDFFINNPDEIISSGNLETDSVLNYMLQKAKRELNTVNTAIVLPEEIQHSFDINLLLGNLLENAIEAARVTEQKYLGISIKLKQGVLKVKIENSFLAENLIQKKSYGIENKFITTKNSKELHGLGLKSVTKIVEKHNGIMDISSEHNIFCVNLVMYM